MNIIVLSPHTDDCELGCGGSLTKWMREGHSILIVVFSLCEKSIPKEFDKNATKEEFLSNIFNLGCNYKILHYPVREFPGHRQDILENMISLKEFNPDLVLCPSLDDIHQDHKVIAEETRRAFRCSILSYELPYTSIDFSPNYYIELSNDDLNNKETLISNYKSQLRKGKYSTELMRSSARVRGSQIDKEYAEAFECVRFVS